MFLGPEIIKALFGQGERDELGNGADHPSPFRNFNRLFFICAGDGWDVNECRKIGLR